MTSPEADAVPYTGRLLVATPSLTDPNFDRTVVLMLAHESDGALGVVLNRPSEMPVEAVLPDWAIFVDPPKTLFDGGPVQPEAAICLAQVQTDEHPPGWTPVQGRLGTVDLSEDAEEMGASVERMRIFSGYAGWDSGQLEGEVDAGAWLVLDLLPGDPFAAQPDALWSMVLRRQGGLLAAVAAYPADPSMN